MEFKFIDKAILPNKFGKFDIYAFKQKDKEHIALSMGELAGKEGVLARLHSECLTGDALFSQRCDCGPQLEEAMRRIAKLGTGVIFYLRQEGRGIGLANKIRAYHLQDDGMDTVEANLHLGFGEDERDYEIIKPMMDFLQIKSLKLMTNNPSKIEKLESYGVKITQRIAIEVGQNPNNMEYLKTKSEKMRHILENLDSEK